MEEFKEGFGVLKWFVDLNSQAKAVIAILSLIICTFAYSNYRFNSEIVTERLRYDKLSDKYANSSKNCKAEQDSLNMIWFNKYEDYRNLREAELKALTQAWEERYNIINKKITQYEKSH